VVLSGAIGSKTVKEERAMPRGYFAVRLTALREDGLFDAYTGLYEAVAQRLSAVAGLSLHAPHRASNPDAHEPDGLSAEDVYLLDRIQVTHADIIIACIELASFGVGAELQMATDFGIPVVAFYYHEATRGPSRLVLGMPSLNAGDSGITRVIRYAPTAAGRADLLDSLSAAVSALVGQKRSAATPRHGLARMLDRRRRELHLSCTDLAQQSGVAVGVIHTLSLTGGGIAEWMRRAPVQRALSLPPGEVDEDRVLLPSLGTTLQIAAALGVSPGEFFTTTGTKASGPA
jgi:hypothetical protein